MVLLLQALDIGSAGTTATNIVNVVRLCVSVELVFRADFGQFAVDLKETKAVYCHLQQSSGRCQHAWRGLNIITSALCVQAK